MLGSACRLKMHFYPRPPGGGRLLLFIFLAFLLCISIHALRVEGDFNNSNLDLIIVISIHALRVEGDSPSPPSFVTVPISIHALRVEGDTNAKYTIIRKKDFYPRPPGGGRPKNIELCKKGVLFLSTPSGWRATGDDRRRRNADVDFYPRLPGGGRPVALDTTLTHEGISIHALRVEGDPEQLQARAGKYVISIHALRVEGDARPSCPPCRQIRHFYPRPPGGGRRQG